MVKLINSLTKVTVDVPDDFADLLGAGWEPVKDPKPARTRATVKKK